MQPLTCDKCGNQVEVEKFSWQHTSVQWLSDSETSCAEFRDSPAPKAGSVHLTSCPALQESIKRAALDGRIAVPED